MQGFRHECFVSATCKKFFIVRMTLVSLVGDGFVSKTLRKAPTLLVFPKSNTYWLYFYREKKSFFNFIRLLVSTCILLYLYSVCIFIFYSDLRGNIVHISFPDPVHPEEVCAAVLPEPVSRSQRVSLNFSLKSLEDIWLKYSKLVTSYF